MNNLEKIIDLQDQYIKLLGEEIESLIGLAYSHGWVSTRYEQGKILREKIQELKDEQC